MSGEDQAAFPRAYSTDRVNDEVFAEHEAQRGLTKREYFAGLAMQASLSYPIPENISGQFTAEEWMAIIANSAVKQADALPEALSQGASDE